MDTKISIICEECFKRKNTTSTEFESFIESSETIETLLDKAEWSRVGSKWNRSGRPSVKEVKI